MAAPFQSPAKCEVRSVIRFLNAKGDCLDSGVWWKTHVSFPVTMESRNSSPSCAKRMRNFSMETIRFVLWSSVNILGTQTAHNFLYLNFSVTASWIVVLDTSGMMWCNSLIAFAPHSWQDFGSALPFQTCLTQTEPVLPLSNKHSSQVQDQGRQVLP